MLSIQPTSDRPWQLASLDLVGPLPKSTSGFMYILSVLDCFSKFVLLFPLRSATGPAVTKVLEEQVFLVYGVPEALIVDNGPQLRGHLFQALLENYQVTPFYTPNYHPQANPVERVHRVVKTMLAGYVKDNHRHWDKFLPKVGAAIRSSRSEVTKLTPNFVNFGREVNYTGKRDVLLLATSPTVPSDDPKALNDALKRVFSDVKKRLSEAYQTSKGHYNLRKRNDQFRLHQKVWKRSYVLSDASKKFTSKLAPKFTGPYIVSGIPSPWAYELTDSSGRNIGTWHAKDLKAHPPDDNNGYSSSDENSS